MEPDFWRERWDQGRIGFHLSEANPVLVQHFEQLPLEEGDRVFVPLCGKTRDIAWLLAQGHRVVGAELAETAVEQLFVELGATPEVSRVGDVLRYRAQDVDIFVGSLFDLPAGILDPVDAIYDRAALVALPADMRSRYAAQLIELTNAAPQLLVTFEYDQAQMNGPPFSLEAAEIRRHYEAHYDLSLVESADVAGGLKGQVAARETVWLLGGE